MPNRRQAIIWINADPFHWRIYAALGEDELKESNVLQVRILDGSAFHSTAHWYLKPSHHSGFLLKYSKSQSITGTRTGTRALLGIDSSMRSCEWVVTHNCFLYRVLCSAGSLGNDSKHCHYMNHLSILSRVSSLTSASEVIMYSQSNMTPMLNFNQQTKVLIIDKII